MTSKNWFMTYLWLELRWNSCLCEIYTPLRCFPLFEWIQCFLWCFLETKCKMILISFLIMWNPSLCFHFSLLHFEKCCSDQFGDWFFTKHVHNFCNYTIIICNFSLLCFRTSKILGWGELISAKFKLFLGLNC